MDIGINLSTINLYNNQFILNENRINEIGKFKFLPNKKRSRIALIT